ncbi:hypothetical protein [Streptomyces sp. AK02-01A]|uniref:hypothetical protein n=1 Tax=Streptomyces sp. AK02-01A TaxID=3028648 RepID=UPI0029BC8C1B|nr:hypothetical protein [Streptomyces sp. AK02-01A]MDX3854008.1 hypothetical protein [Streptomyces sp. AK02-01A]
MDASVWVAAVFGLAGTGIGGGLSVWSSAMAQRQQAAHTREEQRQARASTAIEAALAELFEVQREARRVTPEDQARSRLLHERMLTVQVLMQRVPDADLRTRVREDTFLMPLSPPDDTRTRQERRVDILYLSADAIACLGANLRGEPIPPRTDRVEALPDLWPFFQIGSDRDTFIYEAEE